MKYNVLTPYLDSNKITKTKFQHKQPSDIKSQEFKGKYYGFYRHYHISAICQNYQFIIQSQTYQIFYLPLPPYKPIKRETTENVSFTLSEYNYI